MHWLSFHLLFAAICLSLSVNYRAEAGLSPCAADTNFDGAVNVDDLLTIINGWGDCKGDCPPYCSGDINADCTVNVDDLLGVINNWGEVHLIDCVEITKIEPSSGGPGTEVIISGSFPNPDHYDYCLLGMNKAGDVVPFEVTGVSPTQITGVVGPINPEDGVVQMMIGLGQGSLVTVPPIPGVSLSGAPWSWEADGHGVGSTVDFAPDLPVTAGLPGSSFFGFLSGGDLCVIISGSCPDGTEMNIWPRAHHMDNPALGRPYVGYDAFIPSLCITGSGSEMECANRICATIEAVYLANGIVIDCTASPVPGGTMLCLSLPGLDIDFGTFDIVVMPYVDTDGDGEGDCADNCPFVANPTQADLDSDGIGDVCDDSDGDGIFDSTDNCPFVSNFAQTNSDPDTFGDACDNCPTLSNPAQSDVDGDGRGDGNNDGPFGFAGCDNCPMTPNPAQLDANTNGIGDACEGPCFSDPGCPWDINGNGVVNFDDIWILVNSFFGCAYSPVPPCCGDFDGNGFIDIDDLLDMINNFGPCSGVVLGACALPNDTCTVNTQAQCMAAGGLGWVNGATCLDSDNDRIPNAFELNNCSAPTGAFVGSNPSVDDTDGDMLLDGDEFYGTTTGIDLPAMGCSPLRKNLLMEIDWFDEAVDGPAHSHRPTAGAIAAIVAAFENSTAINPCGGTGVTLIIDYGQGGAFTGGNLIPGGDAVVVFDGEFNVYKAANFAAARNGYFYYAIHCHRYNNPANGSSGIAELNGDDHIVSLQTLLSDSNVSKTMMHEFGHNLNLRHGGPIDVNFKPNYNSIMNYRYQFPGIDTNCDAVGDGALDYSRGLRMALNENALSEAAGVCGAPFGIDWNQSGAIDGAAIARNIKCVDGVSEPCGSAGVACCSFDCNATCLMLLDSNDWANISFTGILQADDVPRELITCDAPRAP